jgi:hypothetical protein
MISGALLHDLVEVIACSYLASDYWLLDYLKGFQSKNVLKNSYPSSMMLGRLV